MALIETRDLWKTYVMGDEEIHALREVSMDIEQGEFVAIMGPSGSGKSTFLQVAGLLNNVTSGEILLKGKNVVKYSEVELAKLRNQEIGFVFQQFNLLERTSAVENVELPLLLMNLSSARRRELANTALELVGLAERRKHLPKQMSGGQEQRVAIARAIATDPRLVVADEPTGNLDSASADTVLEILQTLSAKAGKTVIMVTHDPRAASHGSRTIHLEKGKLLP